MTAILERFMSRCQQKRIKLNSQKLELKAKEGLFHGHLLTTEGLKPDPNAKWAPHSVRQ